MSPNRPNDTGSDGDDEVSSLVAFRRFVDDQVDMAFQGLHQLPRVFGSLATSFDDVERDARQAWQRFNDSFERSINPERRQTDPRLGERSLADIPRNPQERESADPRSRTAFSRPFFMHTFFPLDSKPFLKYDPYSPLVLEEQETRETRTTHGRCRRTRWRHAYEDLVVASRGEAMSTTENRPSAEEEPASAWVKRLEEKKVIESSEISRTIDVFGDVLEKLALPFGPQSGDARNTPHDGRSPATEQDLYERFLQGQAHSMDESKSNDDSLAAKAEPSSRVENSGRSIQELSAPSVLSTLTTTHRQTMPDGSIRTKRVLTKRFADGHVETNESVKTIPQQGHMASGQILTEQQRVSSGAPTKQPSASDSKIIPATNPERRKGGWFWSSS